MDSILHLTPAIAAGLATLLGATLGWLAPFQRRLPALITHGLVAALAATSVRGATSVHVWTLPPIAPDQAMGVVIAALCLLASTTALRHRAGMLGHAASTALLLFTAIVGLLAGSGETGLAIGAAVVAFLSLLAPDRPSVRRDRAATRQMSVTVPQHSSLRLP